VLARITAALAAHKVNVANVSLARDDKGTAMAVIQVDGAVPVAVRDELRAHEAIYEAHRVRVLP
jgi:predicted amino acid-binding ACT domain protein